MFKRITSNLLFLLIASLFVTSLWSDEEESLVMHELNEKERKTLFVEMIEMDIQLRNIASMMTGSDREYLLISFRALQKLKTLESPYYKDSMEAVIRKLQKRKMDLYFNNIMKLAEDAAKHIENTPTDSQPDMSYLGDQYMKIVEQCRNCHTGKVE